ncbi:MAG: hypothetical protein Q7S92_04125 [Candidatus Diapherotrites archaeon]|nr:hypothetical protein [Candidatus Diapherotrites archaeon]
MIQSFIQAIKLLVQKPWLILPAVLIQVPIIGVSAWVAEKFVTIFIQLIFVLESGQIFPWELPIRLLQLNPIQSLEFLLGLLVIAYLNIGMFYVYARFAREHNTGKNASILTASKYTVSKFKELFYLILFFAVIGLLTITAYELILMLSFGIQILGIIFTAALFLLMLYLVVKFLTLIPIISDGKNTLKNGLKKSWAFSQQNFIASLAVIAWISVYSFFFERAMEYIIGANTNPVLVISASIILYGILSTITLIYISLFYFNKHKQEKYSETETITE